MYTTGYRNKRAIIFIHIYSFIFFLSKYNGRMLCFFFIFFLQSQSVLADEKSHSPTFYVGQFVNKNIKVKFFKFPTKQYNRWCISASRLQAFLPPFFFYKKKKILSFFFLIQNFRFCKFYPALRMSSVVRQSSGYVYKNKNYYGSSFTRPIIK